MQTVPLEIDFLFEHRVDATDEVVKLLVLSEFDAANIGIYFRARFHSRQGFS
jgi:hypothetical protein